MAGVAKQVREWILEPGEEWRSWLGHSSFVWLAQVLGLGFGTLLALFVGGNLGYELAWEFGKGAAFYYLIREAVQFAGHRGWIGKKPLPKEKRPKLVDYAGDAFFPWVAAVLGGAIIALLG